MLMSPVNPINLSCGQTALYPAALEAMSRQLDTPIYYPPFPDVVISCVQKLQTLMHTDNDVLLITGSAIYGEEAAMNTVLEPADLCVTVNAGVFGQVLTDLVRSVGCRHVEIKVPAGKVVTVEQVKSVLKEHPDAKMLALVHVETTAGTTNPVADIGTMMREEFPTVFYIVDAVSSLGSLPLHVDRWNIDICCSSSQKCLNAPQGIAIVSVSGRIWEAVKSRKSPVPGLCLDLMTWKKWHDSVNREKDSEQVDSSYTEYKCIHGPSGSYVLLNALNASLTEILTEGESRVLDRHDRAGRALRAGVRAMGLGVLADEDYASPCSTCIVMPVDPFDVPRYMQTVQSEYGIATSGGSATAEQSGYAGSRVGLMGFVANIDSVCRLLEAMEQVLPQMGIEIIKGRAIAEAKRLFEAP